MPTHRRTWHCRAIVACLVALALPGAARPAGAQTCERHLLAENGLRDDDGFITTPVTIAGQAASLLVDTGSDDGLLTEAGASRLGLPRDPDHRTAMQGTGGAGRTVRNVRIPGLAIGTLHLPGASLPVGALPALPVVTPPVAGLLGAAMLEGFDVELDLPRHRIRFWRIQAGSVLCAPPPVWDGRYDSIPLRRQGARMTLDARLDGQPITVLLDSGARSRILSMQAATRLGVDAERLGADPGGITAGVDLRETPYHWHRFRSLTIGTDTQAHPVLTVAPLAEPVDLLLGADWFATRDVWISYATNQLLVRPGIR